MEKNREKTGHSEDLKLSGPKPDFSRFEIKKNQEVPRTRHTANSWDHLIADMDKGDAIDMSKKDAYSFTNRARNLGYVVVLRTQKEDLITVWFGGLKE